MQAFFFFFSNIVTFGRMCAFRLNLGIVKELGDRAAQGRTYGNLGNTHYLLGNFRKAVAFHEQVWCNLKTPFIIEAYSSVLDSNK